VKQKLRHLVVIVPGITGSVLQKDGKDLWAFSARVLSSALFGRDSYLDDLKLSAEDDPALDDLGDGIVPTALMPDAALIPGFIKLVKGYSELTRMVSQSFEIVGHSLQSNEPTNLIEFAYDWRRDNRVAARRLHRVVEERLDQWRKYSANPEAKVIFLVHSMGGLVTRYHLEVMAGWRDCLALVSFGTPYRGSVDAVNFLVNGYSKATLDMTSCLRSFTSSYQLMSTYPVIQHGGRFQTVEEIRKLTGLLGISTTAVASAAGFHREIADKVKEHLADPQYLKQRYRILPFAGTRQPTLQSAVWSEGQLTASRDLPEGVYEALQAGDGTVPRYSAVPEELDGELRETFLAEKHGALQASPILLEDLLGRLQQMQVPRPAPVRGPAVAGVQPSLAVELEDMYTSGEPIRFAANLENASEDDTVMAEISPADGVAGPSQTVTFHREGEQWIAEAQDLPRGMYAIEVRTSKVYPLGAPPVHDLFGVL